MGSAELILIFMVLTALVALPMFIVALVQCLSAQFHEPTNKIVWAIVILMAPVVGPILWWAFGMRQRRLP